MVHFIALVVFAAYFARVPINAAFYYKAPAEIKIGFSGFDIAPSLKPPPKIKRAGGMKPNLGFILEIISRLERPSVKLRLGTGDAAQTAILCGAISSILGGFCDLRVTPVFSGSEMEVKCILTIRAGNAIYGSILFMLRSVRKKWRSTLSKI